MSRRGEHQHYSDRPRKPCYKGAYASFNGKFRNESLSMEWLRSGPEPCVLIEI